MRKPKTLDKSVGIRLDQSSISKLNVRAKKLKMSTPELVRLFIKAFLDGRLRIELTETEREAFRGLYNVDY